MSLRRTDPRREEGIAAVVVIITMLVTLGMLVLALDEGGLLLDRRRMVNAADAGVLAAAESCALKAGYTSADNQASTDPAVPGHIPRQNVDNTTLTRDQFTITAIDGSAGSCDDSSGKVTVRYHMDRTLYFAPILGINGTGTAGATATAIWGVAGRGSGMAPFMLSEGRLTNCNIPNGVNIGDQCGFWWNNNDIGNALWSQVNLNEWNVAADARCPSAGSSDTFKWINGQAPTLSLNYPLPTYACRDTGFAQTVITKGFNQGCPTGQLNGLECQVGKIMLFPVNDPNGQVDSNGNLAPPPATPDKYDMVGFASLLLFQVLKGNDPQAIGTSAANGSCSITHDFTLLPPSNAFNLATQQACNTANLRYPADATKLYPKLSKKIGKVTTVYVYGVNYTYDAATTVITWLLPDTTGVKVEWDWSTPATPGKCGLQASDPNAWCLVSKWEGYQTSGGDPGSGGGGDFGTRGVELTG